MRNPFFLKKDNFLLLLTLVIKIIFLLFLLFKILRFFFKCKFKSIITKSGLLKSNPLTLQFNWALSSFIVFDVEIIHSYSDLNKWVLFWEDALVIDLDLLLIVKKSFDKAILASIWGRLFVWTEL